MAGRPEHRKRLAAAAAAAADSAPKPIDWGAVAAEQLGVEAPEPEESKVPGLGDPQEQLLGRYKTTQQIDREALIHWWSEQMTHQQEEFERRIEAIRTAGEHPAPFFEQQARMFGALGLPMDVAAKLLLMNEADFCVYYGDQYDVGSAQMMIPVAANLLRIATSQNDRQAAKAAEGILSRRGGVNWKPPAQQLEVLKPGDQRKGVFDSRNLSWEDRVTLRQIMERAIAGNGAAPTGLAAGQMLEADGDSTPEL